MKTVSPLVIIMAMLNSGIVSAWYDDPAPASKPPPLLLPDGQKPPAPLTAVLSEDALRLDISLYAERPIEDQSFEAFERDRYSQQIRTSNGLIIAGSLLLTLGVGVVVIGVVDIVLSGSDSWIAPLFFPVGGITLSGGLILLAAGITRRSHARRVIGVLDLLSPQETINAATRWRLFPSVGANSAGLKLNWIF